MKTWDHHDVRNVLVSGGHSGYQRLADIINRKQKALESVLQNGGSCAACGASNEHRGDICLALEE